MVCTAAHLLAGQVSETCRQDIWVTNGSVHALYPAGGRMYLGGKFSLMGRNTGSLLMVDTAEGTAAAPSPRFYGTIRTVCSDGANGFFAALTPAEKSGIALRTQIIRLKTDGTADPSFKAPEIHGKIACLAVSGSLLVAGGDFDSAGSTSRHCLAAFTIPDGALQELDIPLLTGVTSLAVSGPVLFIGGYTGNTESGTRKPCIRAFDLSAGSNKWELPVTGKGIYALASAGDQLYAGGTFQQIDETARKNCAAITIADGSVTEWNPSPDSTVYALETSGTQVFIGGAFTEISFTSCSGVAVYDMSVSAGSPSESAILDFGSHTPTVYALKTRGNTLYFGGNIDSVGHKLRNRAAAFDISTGTVLPWNPSVDTTVYSIADNGTAILLGGIFSMSGALRRKNIAAFDTATGIPTDWNPEVATNGTNGAPIRSFGVYGTRLFAGGEFPSVNKQPRESIAAFDLNDGTLLPWDARLSCSSNLVVRTMAVTADLLYIGGVFDSVGGVYQRVLAAVDPATAAPDSWAPDVGVTVITCAVSGKRIYAGGTFTQFGGDSRRRYLGAISTVRAQNVITEWNPAPDNSVRNIMIRRNTMYVAGYFDTIGGAHRERLAAIDTVTGIATSWNPLLLDPSDTTLTSVATLAAGKNIVFAGGTFNRTNAVHRNLAAIDSATGALLDWNPSPDSEVITLSLYGSTLYAGGGFTSLGMGEHRSHLAAFKMDPVSTVSEKPAVTNRISPAVIVKGRTISVAHAGNGVSTFRMFDIRGRVCLSNTFRENMSVDLSRTAPGMYVAEIAGVPFRSVFRLAKCTRSGNITLLQGVDR